MSAPNGPSKSPSPAGFVIGVPRSACTASAPIHAQMVFGEGSVGRLDDCQHCKVINVDVAEDWLAWERRGSRRLFTVRAPQDRSCRRCAFCRPPLRSCQCATGLAERISQITDEPRFESADRQQILGVVFKIVEPVLGHSGADDLPFEALVKQSRTSRRLSRRE